MKNRVRFVPRTTGGIKDTCDVFPSQRDAECYLLSAHVAGARVRLPQRPRPRLLGHPGSQRGQREDRLPDADHREAEEGRAADRRAGNRQDRHD